MIKFNEKEIALAKKLHDLGVRRKIRKSDWIWYKNKVWMVRYVSLGGEYLTIIHGKNDEDERNIHRSVVVPLWQIHDCLEWLRGKGFRFILHHYAVKEYYLGCGRDDGSNWIEGKASKTPLEALLKAMIAITKEDKNGRQ